MNTKYTPDEYRGKLATLKGGFKVLLDTYENTYVNAKMNPTDSNYQQQYVTVTNGLAGILSNMFALYNDIQSDIQTINTLLSELNKNLTNMKTANANLKTQLGIVDNTAQASSEMISDYEFIYEQRYLRNWALVFSGLACIAAIGIVYKKQITIPPPSKVV